MQRVFTLTAGRTGTDWLARFLTQNLDGAALHEPLEIEDFGTRMPDIRTMRTFNTHGNTAEVQAFWDRKFAGIDGEFYAETNHTLGKCGLIENLAQSDLAADTTIIVLRRDLAKQCLSYLARHDFTNITIAWQWYLHPSYAKRIVDPGAFLALGGVGIALWYCYEMAARQAYYMQKFSDQLRFLPVTLEDITTPDGATAVLAELGQAERCQLPPPSNQNGGRTNPALAAQIAKIIASSAFDPDAMAADVIARGFSFDAPSTVIETSLAYRKAAR